MKPTSSPSVKATVRLARGLATSGTRLTDPNSVSIWRSRWWGRGKMTDTQFYWWRLVGVVKHWFGRHTWVPREDWKMIEGNVSIDIIGYICWHCPATREF